MDWKFIIILTASTVAASVLYYRLMMWVAKKAGVSFPTGGFTKLMFDNHTGDVANAGYLHGRHSISFSARKRDGAVSLARFRPYGRHNPGMRYLRLGNRKSKPGVHVEVVLTRGSLTLEFQDRADGTVVYTWRNGDPGTFDVPLQPGQTLDLLSQALHFSGSITFRGIPNS